MNAAVALIILVIITQVVGSIPTANWLEMIWAMWTWMAPSASIRQLREKRVELMKVREERANTSSQDEFAKWARLDREHQKLKKEYDALNSSVAASRLKLTAVVRAGKWVIAKGALWAVQWHYRKQPVIWLPLKALPYRVEWFLALPKAPLGSVSAVTWVFATQTFVNTVISLVKRARNRYQNRAKRAAAASKQTAQ